MRIQNLLRTVMVLTVMYTSVKIVAGDEEAPKSVKSRANMFEQMHKQDGIGFPARKPNGGVSTLRPVTEPKPDSASKAAFEGGKDNTPDPDPRQTSEMRPEPKPQRVFKKAAKPVLPPSRNNDLQTNPRVAPLTPPKTNHDCSECSKEECKTHKGRYEFCKLCQNVKDIEPCLEGAKEAGFVDTKADFEKMMALSEGKGVKAKDVLPRFEKITMIREGLHNRIKRLENQTVFLKKEKELSEKIDFIKEKIGLKATKVDPEQDLKNYDAVLMTSISGAISTVSMEVCQALVSDFDKKAKKGSRSLFSKTRQFISSQIKPGQKNKHKERAKSLAETIDALDQECKSWKLKVQQANQNKKEVYEVLQELWEGMDAQLEEAQQLLTANKK